MAERLWRITQTNQIVSLWSLNGIRSKIQHLEQVSSLGAEEETGKNHTSASVIGLVAHLKDEKTVAEPVLRQLLRLANFIDTSATTIFIQMQS
jgi:hypothetical protein